MFQKKAKGEVREMKAINPMIILACIILIAAIATYIVPAGAFERVAVEGSEYEMVVADSYQRVENQPIGIFDMFKALTIGLQDAAYIIFFLMILGGTFKIVEVTGALHAGISNMLKLTAGKELILVLFFGSFIFVAFSVIKWGFYIDEMAAIFLIVGILCAIVGKIKPDEVADSFLEGAKDMVWAGIIIGMCYTVTNILQDAQIIDTLVNGMGNILKGLSSTVAACGMFVLQDLLNFLIPSGSGQAAVTMPFMAPLADILGITRQTAVLAFQLGDAFTNVVTPTSGELMAALAICHIPYSKWFKFMGPLWGIWCAIACVMLVIATMIGYC